MRVPKGLFAVLFLLAGSARALTVDELVAKHVAALGGEAKIKALRSVRLTGKIVAGRGDYSREIPWGQVVKSPGMVRSERTIQGLTAVDAFDGREGWSVSPFGGRKEPERASADDLKQMAHDAELEGPLVGWKEKGSRVEYLGTEDVDGTPAHALRVTRKDGDVATLFLDPDTFLAIRQRDVHYDRGTEQVQESDFGSYGEVGGVLFPFAMEFGAPGQPRGARIVIERAEANVPLDDALFRFPAPGQAVGRAIAADPKAPLAVSAPGRTPAPAGPAAFDSGVVSGLGIRNIGSATMSGRIAALAARNENGRTTIFVGSASGGVWKSNDGGTTFKPVFDKEPVQSIGAVTLDPTDPKTVWVGTGEAWTRNSVSIGDGIYKSTDAGDTWKNTGLPESERIVRILVHPKNGSVVYACVPGKLWSDSADRGVYKTTDGGATWTQVLKGSNLSTGCSSLAMDPKDPEVLFAGLWDFRRQGWTFRSGGNGPDAPSGSGLLRTADGGKSWKAVTATGGLPRTPWGRVEVAIAPSDAKVVYALVESNDSALYRSGDGGATWEARDRSQGMVWRPFYFGRLVVDPTNPDRLFKAGGGLIASEDGGKSFSYAGGGGHGDWHDVWIDPENPKHVIGGDDGGLWTAYDGGNRWWKSNNLPVSQFYHVAVDRKDPYHVMGGLQDNSSWIGDSAYPGGIGNDRWENLYNGDGFWVVPDPSDEDAVYAESQGGEIGRIDLKTKAARFLKPEAGLHEKLRFNWNTPIAASPTDGKSVYLGAQFLFRTRDRGQTWERISPDLTTNDPEKQKQEESGGVTVDNSSAEMHTTIYSISESPKDANTIWVGTDDGNVQLTRDAGKSWTNLTAHVAGLPPRSWVSWVEASRHDAATAYACFDRHTFGDMTPWVYRTTDFGKSWTRIVDPGKGVKGYAHVVKEDAAEPRILYLGTELGLFISVDGGARWAEFKGGNFPSVAVRDIAIAERENDVVLATHGRGIWIIDDVTPLRALTADVLERAAGFLPGRPVQQRMRGEGGWVDGDAAFSGANPPGGAVITYYQRTRHLFGPMTLEVLDASGKVVDTLVPSKRRGINRVTWSMSVKPPRVPRGATISWAASRGPRVLPGTYTVRLKKGGETYETKLEVGLDRRAPYTLEDRMAEFDAAMRVHALLEEMSALTDRIEAARAAALKAKDARRAAAFEEIRKKIVATKEGGAITGEERLREHADELYGALLRWEGKPAAYQVERIGVLSRELGEVRREFDAAVSPVPGAPAR